MRVADGALRAGGLAPAPPAAAVGDHGVAEVRAGLELDGRVLPGGGAAVLC